MHAESPHSTHPYFFEFVPDTNGENRFEEFQLPEVVAASQALELLNHKYAVSKGDFRQVLDWMSTLESKMADIFSEVSRSIAESEKNVLFEDIVRRYQKQLTADEREDFMRCVLMHDKYISTIYSKIEEWVAKSGVDELDEVMRNRMLGATEIWGVLSRPELDIDVVVTSKAGGGKGGIYDRSKVVEGLYYVDEKSGNSIRFEVSAVEKIEIPPFEWSGKARLRANGQRLDFFLPGAVEGDIPNNGILYPKIPNVQEVTPIPLGRVKRSQ